MASSPLEFGTAQTSPKPRIYLAVGITVLWLAYQCACYLHKRTLAEAPLAFSEVDQKTRERKWLTECLTVLQSGYQKLRKGLPMFRVTVDDGTEVLILNDRYVKELKAFPDDVLNLPSAIESDLVADYSHLKIANAIGQHALRSDLTPGLPRLMPSIASEAIFALKTHFPQDADDWVPVVAWETALDAVAQVSARLFVGEELCRDPRWLRCSKKSTLMAFKTVPAMKKWPAWMHPLVCHFVPEVQELEKARDDAKALLKEYTKARRERHSDDDTEDYLANWIAKKNPGWAEDYDAQADLQLHLSVAAIHTTTSALTHMLFDLACYPEYVHMLRDEVKTALAESGGEYNKDCIAKMVKTDSFMKESQRLHPPAHTTFMRRALRDITLNDGTFLPKGKRIEIAASPQYLDPDIWENPHQFDGLRFLRLREKTQDKGSHLFVTSNPDYIVWGQGKHACPGRFFAANEIKTLLAMFLLNYDVALPEGNKERPADISVGSLLNPNPTAQILIRRIKE